MTTNLLVSNGRFFMPFGLFLCSGRIKFKIQITNKRVKAIKDEGTLAEVNMIK